MKETGSIKIKDNVYWVGAIDWNIRDFHGYITDRGTTYNAYIIVDEKIALVDTVKHGFYNEMVERIQEIVDPEKIDYVISNHVEMDHSGCLPDIMKDAHNAKVIATEKGAEGLKIHYQADWDFHTVKTGDTLSLGKKNLAFVATPMLHWPDSMATYIKEDNLLLSNDAFGQHLASFERFEDQLGEVVMAEASKYYANILMPLAPLILKKLDEITSMEIEIDMIAPSHGVIWRRDPGKIIEAYTNWSQGIPKKKALIIYDTMWGSTETMARAIGKGLAGEGVEARLLHLRKNGWTEIVNEVLDSKALIIGSPTLNTGVFPTVAGFLAYLKGLKPKNKKWAVFGSYGWGGGAVLAINDELKKAGFEVGEGIEIRYRPDKKGIEKCIEFGANIARKIKE